MKPKINFQNVPHHLAIIMDGNGRWAKKKELDRIWGHAEGIKSLRNIVRASIYFGIKYLTVYAFSSENWQRPKMEVDSLMHLLDEYLKAELPLLIEKRVRLNFIGKINKIPESSQKTVLFALNETKKFNDLILTVALSYGSREEIQSAAIDFAADIKCGKITTPVIDEDFLSTYLYTGKLDIPDPDFLIRTGGEKRISNFLLYQIAYTEIYFTKTMWPDFGRKELIIALRDYEKRIRRFGKTEI